MEIKTVVDSLYNNIKRLDSFLADHSEISYSIFVDANLRKSLLLASASFFEKEIVENET